MQIGQRNKPRHALAFELNYLFYQKYIIGYLLGRALTVTSVVLDVLDEPILLVAQTDHGRWCLIVVVPLEAGRLGDVVGHTDHFVLALVGVDAYMTESW